MRVAKVHCSRYSDGINVSFRVVKQDVNRLDDYDEQKNKYFERQIRKCGFRGCFGRFSIK